MSAGCCASAGEIRIPPPRRATITPAATRRWVSASSRSESPVVTERMPDRSAGLRDEITRSPAGRLAISRSCRPRRTSAMISDADLQQQVEGALQRDQGRVARTTHVEAARVLLPLQAGSGVHRGFHAGPARPVGSDLVSRRAAEAQSTAVPGMPISHL